jgi:Zn-dependent protease with chaperone function
MFRLARLAIVVALFIAGPISAVEPAAEPVPPPSPAVPAAAQAPPPGGSFDPVAATEAWLATLPPEARSRSDAYFEGGYWLQLWGFLYGLGVTWVLLGTGLSARMRNAAERVTRSRFVHGLVYGAEYVVATTVLAFPLSLYQGYFREHQYGLSNLTLGGWLSEQGKGLLLGIVLGSVAIAALAAFLRAAPRTWWIWGTIFSVVLLIFIVLIAPIWIEPIFNTMTELRNPAVRDPILSLARSNGIPARNVYVQDLSKQTKRVSAHVTGFAGTMRIELSDNLLGRTSLPGIKAVMGHEMGHYVLNHIYESIVTFGVILFLGFAFLRWAFGASLRRWGPRWGLSGVADLAALPLLVALFSIYFFVLTPVVNTVIRSDEAEADIFGLNTSRQPDGMAEAALQLGEYRKLHPGPLEEIIFFDHPSGYNRILTAMRWKAEHLNEFRTTPAGR